jgi:hypothetical protein
MRIPLVALFAAAPLLAQSYQGSITGTVSDASGGAIARANVTVTNQLTNVARSVETDGQGRYTVVYLGPAAYTVEAKAAGFKAFSSRDIPLDIDQVARIDVSMQLGDLTQSVEVTAAAPLVNSETSSKGQVIGATEVANLPLVNRDWLDLAMLSPGVAENDGDFAGHMTINGARGYDVNYSLEGGMNRTMRLGGSNVQPSVDAIQEFKVQTSNYTAENGRMSSGIVSAVMKSGTNKFHGSLYDYWRNDAFDARNFFDQDKSKNIRNNFGAALGGPIKRNRLFFFVNYEGSRSREGEPSIGRVPTEKERAGDFTESATVVRDPFAANAPFTGNRIPSSRIHPVTARMLDYVVKPNLAGGLGLNNVYSNEVTKRRSDQILFKGDLSFRRGDSLSYHYVQQESYNMVPFRQTAVPGFEVIFTPINRKYGATFTHLFRPNLVSQTLFSYSGGSGNDYQALHNIDYSKELGIKGIDVDPIFWGFPTVTIQGYTALGDTRRIRAYGGNYHVSSTLWLMKSAHSVRWGGEIVTGPFSELASANATGTFNFLGRASGSPIADFMLGLPNNTSRRLSPLDSIVTSTTYGVFVQDDWKVSRKLTLNLGVRWDLATPPYEKNDRWANFIPSLGRTVVAGEPGFSRPLVNTDWNNIGPRIGLAWRPFSDAKTVIRSGWGIFFGASPVNPAQSLMGTGYPFTTVQNIARVANNPSALTMSDPFPQALIAAAGANTSGGHEVDYKSPNLQQYNLTIERQVSASSAVEVAYVGSKGTHLGRQWDFNQPLRGPTIARPFPRPFPIFGSIFYQGYDSDSNYNALQVSVRRRARALNLIANYTWSKSIDAASTMGDRVNNAYNRDADRGLSNFDRRHILAASAIYSLPWFRSAGTPRLLRAVAGGWQANSMLRVLSGTPFTPTATANLDAGESNRPDRIGPGNLDNPTVDRWFNVRDFVVVPANSFRYGNAGRDVLTAAGRVLINVSATKNFYVREGHRLELRWEMFNVPNHANFNKPDANITGASPGVVTSALDGRRIQIALKYLF